MEKTHWKKLRNPDFIGSYELTVDTDKYIDLEVTITDVKKEMVTGADGKKEECTVAYLKNQKPFILNATNCKTIAKMFGNFIEDWKGKAITLFVQKISAFGERVEALRIRPSMPQLTPTHPLWAAVVDAIQQKKKKVADVKKAYSLTAENEATLKGYE